MENDQKSNKQDFYYEEELAQRIVSSESIVIYGARIVAKEVAMCLMARPYNCKIDAFMVSCLKDNPHEILGQKVITIHEGKNLYKHSLIIVAVLEKYINEIRSTLDLMGFKNIVVLGFESDEWSGLRGNFFRCYMQELGQEYMDINQLLSKELQTNRISRKKTEIPLHLYNVKSNLDKTISMDAKKYPWEISIQVGAALTNQVISNVRDDIGDNISKKNRMYCELTALYWIWKNDKTEYLGLSHYRRHFELPHEAFSLFESSNIDVILTIPIINFPNVRSVYEYDHEIEDWNIMLDAIKKFYPNYYEVADSIQNGIYYYAYNMFIARKDIFKAYCEWLFQILDYCEMNCEIKKDKYQNRFLGFLAERLMTIFFIHNRAKWKIVHCKKNFLT